MSRFAAIICCTVAASPLSAVTLHLELITPDPAGGTVVDIQPLQGADQGGYFLSLRSGAISHRNGATGEQSVILDQVPDDNLDLAYGMTLAPDHAMSGQVYISYATTDNRHVIARYTETASGMLDPNSAQIVMSIQHDRSNNHYGGDVEFGPDGYLYVTTGDGNQDIHASPIDSQDVTNRLGSVLRVDVGGDAYPDDPFNNYAIPADNPDFGAGADPALWAIGLRNPFQATFDPLTGRYFIADVGEDGAEEINIGVAGANYGWNVYEGTAPLTGGGELATGTLTDPFYAYGHDQGQSITGGLVYRDGLAELSILEGQYLFGDFRTPGLYGFDASSPLGTAPAITSYDFITDVGRLGSIVALGRDGAGHLYVSSLYGGVYEVTGVSGLPAVPAPLTLPLLATGFGIMALFQRRRCRGFAIKSHTDF